MKASEEYNQFEPDLNASFSERFEKFKDELLFLADSRFKAYFDARNDIIDESQFKHRLWYYIQPQKGVDGLKPIAILYLKKNSNLPEDMLDIFEDVFEKHFPGNEKNPLLRTILV